MAALAAGAPAAAACPTSAAGARRQASDRVWLLAWTIILLLLTAAPYTVWLLLGPPELERLGSFWFYRDFGQYLSAMRQGAESASWLILDQYSAEPHQPVLMYPLYVGLGKLAAALDVDRLGLYYAAEVLGRVLLVASLYSFAAAFARSRGAPATRLAFLLAAFSLGLSGWLVPLRLLLHAFGAAGLLDLLPASVNVYLEINSFGVFFSAPHLMLGLALTLALPRAYLGLLEGPRRTREMGALVGLAVALAVVHSFNLPVVLSVLGMHAALVAWRARTWRPLAAVLLAGLASAPLLAYHLAVFQLDPFWSQTYGAQNRMPSPHPLTLPIDFGLVFLLAPIGAMSLLRQLRHDAGCQPLAARLAAPESLLLLWIGLGLAWLYVPVPFQRRFGLGLQPGLAVLAALGIQLLLQRLRARPFARRWLSYALLALALNTTILVYLSLLVSAARNEPTPVYAWTRADARAAAWLASASGPQDVVLAATESANTMVGVIPGRVVFGHIVATFRAREKEALMERFFRGAGEPAEQEELLRASRATYVYYGPYERQRGAPPLDALPSLQRVYDRDGVQIYRVRSE